MTLDPILSRMHRGHHWRRFDDGPRMVKRPLTSKHVNAHLLSGEPVGLAPVAPGESTACAAVLDFDSHKGEVPWPEMVKVALGVFESLEERGLRPIPFRSSGGQGIHLWCLWDSPQDARSVRETLRRALESCGLVPGTAGVAKGEVEVYPKQDSVPSDGWGSMVILPLGGVTKSEPLDIIGLDPMAIEDIAWRVSEPVPLVEPESRPERTQAPPASLDLVRSAVDAIPNTGEHELSYDPWWACIAAIHAATGGSEEGLDLAHTLSRKSVKYDESFLDRRVWPSLREREGGITAATLFAEARKHGWNDDVLALFEDLGPEPEEGAVVVRPAGEAVRPPFQTNDKGVVTVNMTNLMLALRSAEFLGVRLAHDSFRDELMVQSVGDTGWRTFTDPDYVRMRLLLEHFGFASVGREPMRDACLLIGDENKFDSAVLWLEQEVPEWDGVPRIETFYPTYLQTVDSPYTRKLGRYQWSAMAARVLEPGAKVDSVPIWVSKQGRNKSTSVASLVVAPEHYVEIKFDLPEVELARVMRGALVGEIAELRGLRTKELEGIKAWVTRTHERWTPKYREFSTTFARRVFLIGTTNEQEFLADETGNRRWLPVRVDEIDRESIERDRMQLWAEARTLYRGNGVTWQGVSDLAREAHREFRVPDAWEDFVLPFIEAPDPADKQGRARQSSGIEIGTILIEALAFDAKSITEVHRKRVGKILREAGLEKKQQRRNGRRVDVFALDE